MTDSIAGKHQDKIVVGGLFTMLAMFSSVALLFAIILLAIGDDAYAAAAAVLVGLLATTDTVLARQAARGSDEDGVDVDPASLDE